MQHAADLARSTRDTADLELLAPIELSAVCFRYRSRAGDSKRFAGSGGWGWAAFEYDSVSDAFRPADSKDAPPQENDAKCGFACHTLVKSRDFVFTEYPKR